MSYFNDNDFVGANFGYPLGNEEYSDFGTPYHTLIDSDTAIAGPSGSQDWYLNPSPEVYAGQSGYQESILLDVSGDQFVDPYTLHTEPAYGGFNTDSNVYGCVSHEQARNIPSLSAGGLAATPRNSFMPPTLYPLAASNGPITPPPMPHQPDNCGTLATPYAAGTLQHGAYEQPLAGPSSASHGPHLHPIPSADKGKARATDLSSPYPAVTGNDTWWYQQPHAKENHGGAFPQTVLGVPPNIETLTAIAHSSGPQRSTKGRGEATSTGRGKGKHAVPLSVAIDSNWAQTKDRFVWALLEEYLFRPAGRSINPETAFANIKKHMKEDLHRSPIAAKAARGRGGKRASRVYEQYTTRILRELRRSSGGEVRSEKLMFVEVLGELTNKLAPINMRCVLRGKDLKTESSNGADEPGEPEELNEPEALNEQDELEELDERDEPEVDEPGEPEELDAKARHRKAERKRRAVIKGLLHKISAFFLVTGNKKVSAGDVILFVITYLRIGELAFPGFVQPSLPGDGQL